MADSASTLEAQQRRAFDADTFGRLQAQPPDAGEYIRRQTSGVGLDSLNSRAIGNIPGVNTAPQNADQAQAAENQKGLGPMARLQQMQKMRQQALAIGSAGTAQAIALANAAYARVLNSFQSELIANVLALEIVVSPWLFLLIFFMRVFVGLVPLRIKGISVIPPYTLRTMGGIGVFITHLAAALVILTILFLIFFLFAFIVWAISQDPITQTQLFLDLSGGALGGLWTLITGS